MNNIINLQFLDVLPIDIAPANSEVFKCDFLQVEIGESSVRENTTFSSLEKESFGVIIFCLLLGKTKYY